MLNKNSTILLHTGNTIPVMGLGTWQLTHNTVESIVYALERGYRLIDTSGDYGTQPAVGQAIKESGMDRKDLYIITKIEQTDNAYEASKKNLKELGLSYVDLMLIHRPPDNGAGEELWEGLIRAQKEGLTQDIGVSNYSILLIESLIDASGQVPTVNQIEWNPFGYSREMMKYCGDRNIVIQAYSPLTRAKRLSDQTLLQIANKYHKSPTQILIRWNLQLGTVPIPKANNKQHIDENIDVFDFELDENDMSTLNSLNEEFSAIGSLQYL